MTRPWKCVAVKKSLWYNRGGWNYCDFNLNQHLKKSLRKNDKKNRLKVYAQRDILLIFMMKRNGF